MTNKQAQKHFFKFMGDRIVGCGVKRGGHVVADLGGFGIKAFFCKIAQQITLRLNLRKPFGQAVQRLLVLPWLLWLQDFRSYHELTLPLDDGLTAIVGPNGVGKTNLLEAIGLLATLKSFRGAPTGAREDGAGAPGPASWNRSAHGTGSTKESPRRVRP